MTTRTDVVVDFDESPRIIEIAQPSTEMTMQDLVDTVRKIEDDFTKGLSQTKLLDASGKQDLGGGVFVGITTNLSNAKLSFEPRRTPTSVGTVTTGSGIQTPRVLGNTYTFIDSGADFASDGVEVGALVINFTDRSIADVVEIISPTELRTRLLENGVDNEWDASDVYQVFNIVQCDATGGNLVANDGLGSTISSILPTSFTQVVKTASSSATISEQQDIQFASFGGGVTVDTTSSNSGTTFPVGTPREPVNNFTDALTIATSRGFKTFFILGDATVDSGLDYTGFSFIGESKSKTTLTVTSGATVTNAEFTNATIGGTLDGGSVFHDCRLTTIDFVDGFIEQCTLNETITLSGAVEAHFLDCFSGVPGVLTPTIDMGGSGTGLAIRNYNGGIKLTNKTGSESVSIDMGSGQVIIDDTVTTGTIILRGIGKWTNKDTYVGGADVVNELVNPDSILDALDSRTYDGVAFSDLLTNLLSMATGRIVESATGVFNFYEQDNSTIAFTLTKAASERTRS